jgi:hypothetical protein
MPGLYQTSSKKTISTGIPAPGLTSAMKNNANYIPETTPPHAPTRLALLVIQSIKLEHAPHSSFPPQSQSAGTFVNSLHSQLSKLSPIHPLFRDHPYKLPLMGRMISVLLGDASLHIVYQHT